MSTGALPDDLPGIPLLLRETRGVYSRAIRAGVDAAGLPSLPTNGPFILAGLHAGVPYSDLVRERERSIEKFETVQRLRGAGYLEGPEDDPVLSERGHEAAHVVEDAIAQLTNSLQEHLGEVGMRSFVGGLLFLMSTKERPTT